MSTNQMAKSAILHLAGSIQSFIALSHQEIQGEPSTTKELLISGLTIMNDQKMFVKGKDSSITAETSSKAVGLFDLYEGCKINDITNYLNDGDYHAYRECLGMTQKELFEAYGAYKSL